MDSIEEISEEEFLNYFFISVVKKYPALYAKGNKCYRNASNKDSLWLAVSNEVKISGKYSAQYNVASWTLEKISWTTDVSALESVLRYEISPLLPMLVLPNRLRENPNIVELIFSFQLQAEKNQFLPCTTW